MTTPNKQNHLRKINTFKSLTGYYVHIKSASLNFDCKKSFLKTFRHNNNKIVKLQNYISIKSVVKKIFPTPTKV